MLRMPTSKGTHSATGMKGVMSGRKRSDGSAAAAKITKYFCSEAVSTGSDVSEGRSQTGSDVRIESKFTSIASFSASSSGTIRSNVASLESESMDDLGHIINNGHSRCMSCCL